jgi:enoyl-CoA hydratase/carnithine racemase
LGRTLRLAVLGVAGRIDASEALHIGLVDEVLPPSDLMSRALELAHAAASGSPAAIEASKRAIHGAIRRPMEEDLEAAYELLVAHRAHPDAAEGPRAFVEKRPPQWSNMERGNDL